MAHIVYHDGTIIQLGDDASYFTGLVAVQMEIIFHQFTVAKNYVKVSFDI